MHGIEPNKSARSRALEKGITLAVDSHDFQSEKFDVITMWHVLEHVYDLKSQIIELEHLLKKMECWLLQCQITEVMMRSITKNFGQVMMFQGIFGIFTKSFKHLFREMD